MNRSPKRPAAPAIATDEIASKNPAPSEGLHRAPTNRASLVMAAVCVLCMLAVLIGQLGWWSALAAPAYLATTALMAMLTRGRTLLAVGLSTASMGIIVALVKLSGLA